MAEADGVFHQYHPECRLFDAGTKAGHSLQQRSALLETRREITRLDFSDAAAPQACGGLRHRYERIAASQLFVRFDYWRRTARPQPENATHQPVIARHLSR